MTAMTRSRPQLFAALALVAALGAAVDVRAQTATPASTPSPEVVKQADAHFRKGNLAYTDKRWAEAEAAFLAAWALNPTYDVAANLGQTQYHLGKLRDAAEHLDFALRHWPLIGKPEPRKLAEDRLAEVRGSVGALKLEVKAEHADLYVDGKLVGHSPMVGEVFVEPGAHKVEARHELYGTEARRVIAGVGATEAVRFGLGEVVVGVGSAAGKGEAREVVGVGSAVGWRPGREWALSGGAVAAVGLGAGLALTFASKSKASDADAKLSDVQMKGGTFACSSGSFAAACATLRRANQSADTLSKVSAVGYVAAGVGGAVLSTYLLWPGKKAEHRTSTWVSPVVGAGIGGIAITGAF